jgi:hypothetical protein
MGDGARWRLLRVSTRKSTERTTHPSTGTEGAIQTPDVHRGGIAGTYFVRLRPARTIETDNLIKRAADFILVQSASVPKENCIYFPALAFRLAQRKNSALSGPAGSHMNAKQLKVRR